MSFTKQHGNNCNKLMALLKVPWQSTSPVLHVCLLHMIFTEKGKKQILWGCYKPIYNLRETLKNPFHLQLFWKLFYAALGAPHHSYLHCRRGRNKTGCCGWYLFNITLFFLLFFSSHFTAEAEVSAWCVERLPSRGCSFSSSADEMPGVHVGYRSQQGGHPCIGISQT